MTSMVISGVINEKRICENSGLKENIVERQQRPQPTEADRGERPAPLLLLREDHKAIRGSWNLSTTRRYSCAIRKPAK
jgi:hypothetical protein